MFRTVATHFRDFFTPSEPALEHGTPPCAPPPATCTGVHSDKLLADREEPTTSHGPLRGHAAAPDAGHRICPCCGTSTCLYSWTLTRSRMHQYDSEHASPRSSNPSVDAYRVRPAHRPGRTPNRRSHRADRRRDDRRRAAKRRALHGDLTNRERPAEDLRA